MSTIYDIALNAVKMLAGTGLLLFLFQLPFVFSVSPLQKIICVHKSNSSDLFTHHNCTLIRKDLSSGAQEVSDNTVLLLLNKNETLESNIPFMNVSGLTLSGNNETNISCNQQVVKYGLRFINVSNLRISGLSIINCGALHQKARLSYDYNNTSAAIFINKCTNLEIHNTIIRNSHGTGLALFDCNGKVEIFHSCFYNNTPGFLSPSMENQIQYSGGGIYYELTRHCNLQEDNCTAHSGMHNSNGSFTVHNCSFTFNSVAVNANVFDKSFFPSGGLIVFLSGFAHNNTVNIENSNFISNTGVYGAGLFIVCRESSTNNSIRISNVTLFNNNASLGGGGLDIGFKFRKPAVNRFNSIIVQSCNISSNRAYFGGGTVFFVTSASQVDPSNTIEFRDTVWKQNKATYGSAIYLEPIFNKSPANTIFPVPHFVNCNFTNNYITFNRTGSSSSGAGISSIGTGAMNSKAISFRLSGHVTFSENNGSAVYLIDSNLIASQNTLVNFSNNTGTFGGALSINGFASIYASSNTSFVFLNNKASVKGGAIYFYSTDIVSSLLIGASCFVEHFTEASKTITFYFRNNADSFGKSLYVSSLLPCNTLCQSSKVYLTYMPAERLLTGECVGNFTFADHNGTVQGNVATETSEFYRLHEAEVKKIVPGKGFTIPFVTRDELGHQSMEPLIGILTTNNDSLYLTNTYTALNRFRLRGQPNDTGHLEIGTLYFRNLTVGIDVTMSACPPGFINKNNTCVCSADYDSDHYYGIVRCDNREFEASLSSLFWVGYIGNESEDTLFTGQCPQGYCNYNQTFHVLPSVPSFSQLDSLICGGSNRTGILCGDCMENNSVYYNSPGYICGNNELCSYGPLFYILTSIIPLTLIFTIIVMLGVNFNSGIWNGFVFFSQIVGYFTATVSSISYASSSERVLHIIPVLIYSLFSLQFFNDDSLSFCLFKNADFFAIMGIEILSLVFAFLLVTTLVSVMKSNYFYRLQTACCKRPFFKPTTLTKALTTFLILCYSQTTQICFKIMEIGFLTNKGSSVIFPLRVQQMGSQAYFTGIHIPFAIAAIIGIVAIVIVTPLCLIAYPIFYKVLPQRNRVAITLVRKVEMLKPIFDAFQSCFKDKYRFFAGLYFLYRVIFVSIFSLINVPLASLSIAQVVLMIMLAIHLKFEPYKNKLHNNIDSCLFLLMGIINTLTLARFVQLDTYSQDKTMIVLGYIQLFLVYLPIFIIICLLIGLARKKLCRKLPQMRDLADLKMLSDSYDSESCRDVNAVSTNYIDIETVSSLESADGSKLRKELEDLEDSL